MITQKHKEHIDSEVDIIKEEMKLLADVQKPHSDIKEYVSTLQSVLTHKIGMIMSMKNQLEEFTQHLEEEEKLSKEFKDL